MRMLLAVIFVLLATTVQAAEPEVKFTILTGEPEMVVLWEPPTSLVFMSPEGLKVVFDFSGETLSYSGNLPVAESARIFFDAMFKPYLACSQ